MENFHEKVHFLFPILILFMLVPISIGQLSPSETRILYQVQQILEYPDVLQGWNNWTNFCDLPWSPSLRIVCSENRLTELTVIGNKTSSSQQKLSGKFSIDTFFTVLTKLSNLRVLSLVSLGLWGQLPAKINRFWSLEVLNISSNFIYGEIPASITSMKNLTSLVLADNLFNGSVPDLKRLALLEELDLGDNHFGPKFPSLSTNLVSIVLKNNSIRTEIPSVLVNFDQLQKFDVSSNEFLGSIPSSLFSLPSILYLNLAQNQLSGALPVNVSCSKNLTFVDISRNLLIGILPSCIGLNSSNRTVISSWNCLSSGNPKNQHPYSYCYKEALAVRPPVRSQEKGQESIKLGVILGIIGGVVGVIGVSGLLVLAIFRKAEARRSADANNKHDRSVGHKTSALSSPIIDSRHVPRTMRVPALGLPPYQVFTLEEMEDATNNFDPSNLIGEGSQGQLYKGWLSDGSLVLVKCLKLKQKHSSQSLQQYVKLISTLRHRHVVSVLGHCIVTYQDHPNRASTVFIVLEHVSTGSLRDHLTDWRKKEMLKWPQRMGIMIGVARGLQFLHTGTAPGIFGNSLKIENILLDESLSAKISNYNIPAPSKMGSESPLDRGSAENDEKDDIFQLGSILLEVITGKQIKSERELDELKLELERSSTEPAAKLQGAVDPSIRGTFAYDSIRTAVEIIINCLNKEPSKRPSIEDVLWNLQYSIQVQEGWTSSGNLSAQR